MRTIKDIVSSRVSSNEILKSVRTDERIEQTYKRFPKLRQIDIDIVSARGSRFALILEGDEAPLASIEKLEGELIQKRKDFLLSNNIPDDFDHDQVICSTCMDTGYITSKDGRKVVCKICMKDAIKEAFDEAGMKDYDTYNLSGFKIDYFPGDKRKRQFTNIRSLIDGKDKCNNVSLLLGTSQSGKTYLSIVTVKYAISLGKSAYYIKSDDLASLSQETIDELKDYDYVVIDDFAPEITMFYKNACAFYKLLESRTAKHKPTVVVSSNDKKTITDNSEERIAGILKRAVEL